MPSVVMKSLAVKKLLTERKAFLQKPFLGTSAAFEFSIGCAWNRPHRDTNKNVTIAFLP